MGVLNSAENLLIRQQRRDLVLLALPVAIAAGETVKIGSETFTAVAAEPTPPATLDHYEFVAGSSAAESRTNLAERINSQTRQGIRAINEGATSLLIVNEYSGSRALPCSDTLAGSGNGFLETEMNGGTAFDIHKNFRPFDIVSKVATPGDHDAGAVYIALGFEPVSYSVQIRNAAGESVDWDGAIMKQAEAGNILIVDNSGSDKWAAGDIITVIAAG